MRWIKTLFTNKEYDYLVKRIIELDSLSDKTVYNNFIYCYNAYKTAKLTFFISLISLIIALSALLWKLL